MLQHGLSFYRICHYKSNCIVVICVIPSLCQCQWCMWRFARGSLSRSTCPGAWLVRLVIVFCQLALRFVNATSNYKTKMGSKRNPQNARKRPGQTTGQAAGGDNKNGLSKFAYDYSKDYADPSWPYHKGKMDKGAKFLIVAFPTFIICLIGYVYYNANLKEIGRTPLDKPKIISPMATSAQEDPEKFWGTYRSGLYFGLKTRSPKSPVAGLMWMTQMTGERPSIRHWCNQDDRLPMYGWFGHDGLNFGIQQITDQYYTILTDFVKRPGGAHGGDWTARVKMDPRAGAEEAVVSLFFYLALDGQGKIEPEIQKNKLVGISGHTEELGQFRMIFPTTASAKANYLVAEAPGIHQLKETMMQFMQLYSWDKGQHVKYVGLEGKVLARDRQPNFIVLQLTFKMPFEFEVVFESGSFVDRGQQLTGPGYQAELNRHLIAFDNKFEATFQLQKKGYSDNHISFAKAALSNMLGSIGYFYGASLIRSKYTTEPLAYWNTPLYTAVPSRSFFPRGFLWDEGFHNLLISKWDPRLSMDIIGHWLDLMNVEGWIPREQILGLEARAKVPDEFVVQYNENANPPTLFLPLQDIVKQLISSDNPKDKLYLRHLFPRLEAWYNWFNVSQIGQEAATYRWRGRNATTNRELNPKTLTSGLDDYPRASHPSDVERHLDLRCWMALASRVIADIAQSLNESWTEYDATHKLLTDNKLLDTLHWSEKAQRYTDYGLHSDQLKLERPKPKPLKPGQRPMPPAEKERVTKKQPQHNFVDSHFGYVSLFPFMLKIVDPHSLKLGKILIDLQDPNLLWTKFGLRSLAKNSPLYKKYNTEHDPPYWRGAIWINLNYLTVGALYHYSRVEGPYQETAASVYTELRDNIVNNIYHQYRSTGYIWEQYDDDTGNGKGSHPFTGWSSLVVAIMAEQY